MERNAQKAKIREDVRKHLEDLREDIKASHSLLTDSERYFYEDLKKYIGDQEYQVFAKVAILRDLIFIRNIGSKEKAKRLFNRVQHMHIDFVVTDAMGKIIQCFELDGDEHEWNRDQILRDEIKNGILEYAGIPLERVMKSGETYQFTFLDRIPPDKPADALSLPERHIQIQERGEYPDDGDDDHDETTIFPRKEQAYHEHEHKRHYDHAYYKESYLVNVEENSV